MGTKGQRLSFCHGNFMVLIYRKLVKKLWKHLKCLGISHQGHFREKLYQTSDTSGMIRLQMGNYQIIHVPSV